MKSDFEIYDNEESKTMKKIEIHQENDYSKDFSKENKDDNLKKDLFNKTVSLSKKDCDSSKELRYVECNEEKTLVRLCLYLVS